MDYWRAIVIAPVLANRLASAKVLKATDRLSMQKAADNGLFVPRLSSLLEFRQFSVTQALSPRAVLCGHLGVHLVNGAFSRRLFVGLGEKLVALAEHAYSLRQLDNLGELSGALLALPLPGEYHSAARYFRGLELIRRGELDQARSVFETVATGSPHRYTARAIQSLGVTFHARGDFESALKLYVEASSRAAQKGNVDRLTSLVTLRNIAVVKSGQGDHRGALADLERMSQFARAIGSIHPHAYYDYLNSVAVELSELGRLEEAARVSRVALSSPFAVAYPEWRETFDDVASKKRQRATRSAVAVRQPVHKTHKIEVPVCEPPKLLHLPAPERPLEEQLVNPGQQGTRARILDFQQWKTAIKTSSSGNPNGVSAELRRRLTTGEKLIRLMDLISQDETDDDAIDRILQAVEQIIPKRRGEKLD